MLRPAPVNYFRGGSRLKPTNVQAAVFLRAGGARRFAFNWALAQVKANQDQWAAEATYDIPKGDRTRPFSHFDLIRRWDATKAVAAVARRPVGLDVRVRHPGRAHGAH